MSLTEVAYYSKKFAPFAILGLVVLLIVYFAFQILFLLIQRQQEANQPVEQISLNPAFGVIPRPELEEAKPSSRYAYTLDTIDGVPPTATSAAQVFFLPEQTVGINFRSRAYLMAKNIGFDTEKAKYDYDQEQNLARFRDGAKTLIIDAASLNFNYQSKLTNNDPSLKDPYIPGETSAQNEASEFLRTIDRYPTELAQGKNTILYVNYDTKSNQLAVVDDPEQANMVEVDFNRPDIDGFPVVAPKYFNTENYVVLLYGSDGSTVVRAQVKHYERSEEQIGIYPIKTGQQAWEALLNGEGLIVSFPPNSVENVKIKSMNMGYLEPEWYAPYLQPVYIFLGEDNFVAYVPAITDEYLEPFDKPANKEEEIPASEAGTKSQEDSESTSSATQAKEDTNSEEQDSAQKESSQDEEELKSTPSAEEQKQDSEIDPLQEEEEPPNDEDQERNSSE